MIGLYPQEVTYKMTHSEIANKARKLAAESKLKIKEKNRLSYYV